MICGACQTVNNTEDMYCHNCGATTESRPLTKLQEWRILSKTPFFYEDPHVIAGRQGEAFLQSLIEKHINYKGAHCFAGKRVSCAKVRGRREIDLIVVTPTMVHIIEVKNWSGQLYTHGSYWLHVKRDGTQKQHPNLINYNGEKQTILMEYLAEQGIQLSPQHFTQKIVFPNTHFSVDASLYNDPNIITANKLGNYLNGQSRNGVGKAMVCSLIEYCFSSEKASLLIDGLFNRMTKDTFNSTVQAISNVRTWDRLLLNGTKVITGDLLKLSLNGQMFPHKSLASSTNIKVFWTRNKLLGLAKALLNIGNLGKIKIPSLKPITINTQDYVFFHAAGQQKPNTIPLSHINHIEIG